MTVVRGRLALRARRLPPDRVADLLLVPDVVTYEILAEARASRIRART